MKKANNLSKFDKKALRLLFAVLFVPLFVSLVFIYELSVYDSSRELPAGAQKIGSSDYYNIGGKIYLRSWNLAPYELEGGADAASFRALDTGCKFPPLEFETIPLAAPKRSRGCV